MTEHQQAAAGALRGLKVLDVSTLFAGPLICTLMADFGADVIKVERPTGDGIRSMAWQKDGTSLWWLLAARNKRCITLDLHHPRAQDLLRELVADADILVENFRPGTMERWGLGYEDLKKINPRLVMVRVTAFGQTGPYSHRPGFGTLAESMSGFAHINGSPDGPPMLPPIGLADAIAALFGTFSAMFAIYDRDVAGSGVGQFIDLSIYEPLFWILGPQATVWDQLGIVQQRTGNRAPFTAPRGAFRTKDGEWLGLSGSTQSVAERTMRAVGREDLIHEPWFADHSGRIEHQDELDAAIQKWIGARDATEVLRVFEEHEASIAPIYSIADIIADPHFQARDTVTSVPDPRLGDVRIQNVVPRLSATPGTIRHLGPPLGEHTVEVLCEQLGYDPAELEGWRDAGII